MRKKLTQKEKKKMEYVLVWFAFENKLIICALETTELKDMFNLRIKFDILQKNKQTKKVIYFITFQIFIFLAIYSLI